MKVLNLSQIWTKFKQNVDDLIYENIKFKQDINNLIYESIKFKLNLTQI